MQVHPGEVEKISLSIVRPVGQFYPFSGRVPDHGTVVGVFRRDGRGHSGAASGAGVGTLERGSRSGRVYQSPVTTLAAG
jgi:hypothetical protein